VLDELTDQLSVLCAGVCSGEQFQLTPEHQAQPYGGIEANVIELCGRVGTFHRPTGAFRDATSFSDRPDAIADLKTLR
jgi:hypothetical protein